MKRVLLGISLMLAACGGGGGGGEADGKQQDSLPFEDSQGQYDTVPTDQAAPQDLAGDDVTPGDDLVMPDTTPPEDVYVEPGTGQLGDPCQKDGDCESTICWNTQRGSGCTVKCETQAECQAYGLVCMWIREGVKACAPINGQVSSACTQSAQCPYPTVCIAEFSWCDLPTCTFDAECSEGLMCKAGFRECEPTTCASTYECKNPLEFCLDDVCGPPKCTSRADCAEGEICNMVQGECQAVSACDAEGKCSYYNEVCVDGLCEPNRCVSPCSHAGDVCNASTGKCGPACSATTACAAGWGCDLTAGVCYVNNAPVAVAKVEKGSTLLDAVTVTAGTPVKLVGHLSVDPEGKPLEYIWTLIDIPSGTNLVEGGPVSGDADTTFTPTVPGLYQFGLRVQDETGIPSAQAQATVFVK